jgi:hypothetical protein
MAIPTHGALFITNPRPAMKLLNNPAKNKLVAKYLGWSISDVKKLKRANSRNGERGYDEFERMFQKAGGDAALRRMRKADKSAGKKRAAAYKAKGRKKPAKKGYSVLTTKTGAKQYRKDGKLISKAAYMRRKKPAAKKPAKKGYSVLTTKAGHKQYRKDGKLISKAAYMRRKKPAAKKPAAKLNNHQKYVKKLRPLGYSMLEIGAYYRLHGGKLSALKNVKAKSSFKKVRKAPARKKPAASKAKKARPTSGYRKLQTKRGMRYMKDGKFISKAAYNRAVGASGSRAKAKVSAKASRTALVHPGALQRLIKGYGVRVGHAKYKEMYGDNRMIGNPFGGLALRRNGRKNPMVLGLLSRATSMISRIPVIGPRVAPFAAPLGLAALGTTANFFLMRSLGPKIPEFTGYVGGLLGKEEMGYTVGSYAQKMGYTLGGVAIFTGLSAISRYFPKMMAQKDAMALGLSALGSGAAIDMYAFLMARSTGMSDGMDYESEAALNGLAYTGGNLNGLAYTGGNLNGLAYTGGNLNGIASSPESAYGAVAMIDAAYSGPDFTSHEGQALLAGPNAWFRRFGMPARRVGGRGGPGSSAGQLGHRWGWLIRLIGFERVRMIAAMAPAQRLQVLDKLRNQAQATVDSGDYSGLAYTGGNLNGLAYTGGNLNGAHAAGGAGGPSGYGALAYVGGAL